MVSEAAALTQPCAAETQHYDSGCCEATTLPQRWSTWYSIGVVRDPKRLRLVRRDSFSWQCTRKQLCNVIVGYHGTCCRMRETLDPEDTSTPYSDSCQKAARPELRQASERAFANAHISTLVICAAHPTHAVLGVLGVFCSVPSSLNA